LIEMDSAQAVRSSGTGVLGVGRLAEGTREFLRVLGVLRLPRYAGTSKCDRDAREGGVHGPSEECRPHHDREQA
jgi:hypothetical protein